MKSSKQRKRGIIEDILHKFRFGVKIIKIYKTWLFGFLDYFKVLGKRRIIHKLRNNIKYLIRTGTSDFGIINEVYIVKEYNKLSNFIRQDSVVIDIGAHIGVFSILAGKKAFRGKVFAYEPFEENFEMLNKNITLNNMKNISAFKLGISNKKGKRKLVISRDNSGGHSFYEKNGEKVEIKTITLKQVFEQNKIKKCDFLKIDCEGAEYEILLNTPFKYLKKIKSISAEYHDTGDINKLKEYLEKAGFNVEINENIGEGMLYAWC
jgi:FkbM family methyltransferase